jgi:hypothetical protein
MPGSFEPSPRQQMTLSKAMAIISHHMAASHGRANTTFQHRGQERGQATWRRKQAYIWCFSIISYWQVLPISLVGLWRPMEQN